MISLHNPSFKLPDLWAHMIVDSMFYISTQTLSAAPFHDHDQPPAHTHTLNTSHLFSFFAVKSFGEHDYHFPHSLPNLIHSIL